MPKAFREKGEKTGRDYTHGRVSEAIGKLVQLTFKTRKAQQSDQAEADECQG